MIQPITVNVKQYVDLYNNVIVRYITCLAQVLASHYAVTDSSQNNVFSFNHWYSPYSCNGCVA